MDLPTEILHVTPERARVAGLAPCRFYLDLAHATEMKRGARAGAYVELRGPAVDRLQLTVYPAGELRDEASCVRWLTEQLAARSTSVTTRVERARIASTARIAAVGRTDTDDYGTLWGAILVAHPEHAPDGLILFVAAPARNRDEPSVAALLEDPEIGPLLLSFTFGDPPGEEDEVPSDSDVERTMAEPKQVSPEPVRALESLPPTADASVGAVPRVHPTATLQLLDEEPSRTFSLQTRTTIGRSPRSDLDLMYENAASRHHATVRWNGRAYTITDEGSMNGTAVGKQSVPGGEPVELNDGDVIRIGKTRMLFRVASLRPEGRVQLTSLEAACLPFELAAPPVPARFAKRLNQLDPTLFSTDPAASRPSHCDFAQPIPAGLSRGDHLVIALPTRGSPFVQYCLATDVLAIDLELPWNNSEIDALRARACLFAASSLGAAVEAWWSRRPDMPLQQVRIWALASRPLARWSLRGTIEGTGEILEVFHRAIEALPIG